MAQSRRARGASMWLLAAVVGVVTLVLFDPSLLKRGLLVLAGAYKSGCRLLLALKGRDTTTEAERRVASGEAWDEFCDTLKAAGAVVLSPSAPRDALSQAEGYRYLSRVARAGLENFVECSDTDAPTLTSIVDGYRAAPCKLGSDNPDNLYQNATIDGRKHYVVLGTRGTVHYLEFSTKAGQYGQPGGLRTVGSVEAADLATDGAGAFVLLVGPTPLPGFKNYLAMDASVEEGRGLFMVRQTFLDRAAETAAALSIVRLPVDGGGGKGAAAAAAAAAAAPAAPPPPLTCERLDEGLRSAGLLVAAAPLMFARWAEGFKAHVNELPLFDQERSNAVGGDPAIRYYHSYWRLGPEEALVIDARPPPCSTWNFQLNNYWMESLDYRYHPVCVNKASAQYGDFGAAVRIVVSHTRPPSATGGGGGGRGKRDPPINWISTAGHGEGTMCFRWVKPEVPDDKMPLPTARVVPIASL